MAKKTTPTSSTPPTSQKKSDGKKTATKKDEKKSPQKTEVKKGPKPRKAKQQLEQPHKIKMLLAIIFLALIVITGLIIVVRWPAPTIPPVVERIPITTQPTKPVTEISEHKPELEITDQEPTIVRAKIAILMDDLGINLERGIAAINLDLPISIAIIPSEQYATDIMMFAHEKQREILIHLPMQPISYPKNNPGPLGLFISQTDDEIIANTKHLIELIPYATGGNNHMGSEFTRHRDKMDLVLTEMSKAGLFFVDSLTIADSVAYQEALRLGVPTSIRDRFLDNEREVDKISAQLEGLVTLAKENGHAIGICHPYPETIIALEHFSQQLDALNIEIVPLSQLVH